MNDGRLENVPSLDLPPVPNTLDPESLKQIRCGATLAAALSRLHELKLSQLQYVCKDIVARSKPTLSETASSQIPNDISPLSVGLFIITLSLTLADRSQASKYDLGTQTLNGCLTLHHTSCPHAQPESSSMEQHLFRMVTLLSDNPSCLRCFHSSRSKRAHSERYDEVK